MNEPIRKTKFDGVYMPPCRPRGPENIPQQVSQPTPASVKPVNQPPPAKEVYRPLQKSTVPFKPRENIVPTEPIPVDARQLRYKEDVEMKEPEPMQKENKERKKPIHLQDYAPQSNPAEPKLKDPSPDQVCTGPR